VEHREATSTNDGGDIRTGGATASVPPTCDNGRLREHLEAERTARGLTMGDLTVLSSQRDPFRLDTPANHRDARWLSDQVAVMLDTHKTIHLRGLHYMLLGRIRPCGSTYVNDDPTWLWLSEKAAKAARWLGYLPFERIVDQRNAAPVVRLADEYAPRPMIDLGGVRLELPAEVPEPTVWLYDFKPQQPFRLALYCEKSSAEPVLGPVAADYGADLYLPTGEISDTMLHTMAATAAEDGRPLVVLTFADCDPSGWQMPVSIARKLQALQVALFPSLRFEVHRVGLLPEHVRTYGLPSTPLKATEKRADRWQAAMGVQQTEIDALASLQPDVFEALARGACDPFYDHTLNGRAQRACLQWEQVAQTQLHEVIGEQRLADFRTEAQAKLDAMRDQVDALNGGLRLDASDLDLPDFEAPEPVVPDRLPEPLVSSGWTFADQCASLKASKAYEGQVST
jgi:hypothetical protein